ncbi:MAG TPA: helix-turn-helix domain-containing protein [Candidatus Nanoarchaeia archaeon]|nr:helix-turn-helix domain-containing protein [Candidatus Nanoarchaeia archaeon]
MQVSKELAKQIQTKARAILDREVLIAGTDGSVLAGSDGIGEFIPDALKACQEGRQVEGHLGTNSVVWVPFVYEYQTIGVFGVITSTGQITPEAISLLQGLAEVIVHQYYLLDKVQSTETVRAQFLGEFLTASSIDTEAIYRQSDIMQLNLRSPQAVILARLEGFESSLHASASHLSIEEQRLELSHATEKIINTIREGFQNYQDNIASYLGHDTFVILKGIGGSSPNTLNTIRFLNEKGQYLFELLSKNHNDKVTIGVGQYYPDLGGLRKSFQDAKLALEVGLKVWGPGRVYHIKQVGMFVTLANISQDRKAELAHQILHPLLRDQQLYKTVRAFLTSGLNLTETAKQLHVHRNTLIYRLDKTKKLIALDPRHFDDALQIKLGLMFYQPA